MGTKILVIPWDAEPHVVEAEDGETLKVLQTAVGGYVECVSLHAALVVEWGDLWLNEEGELGDGYLMIDGDRRPKTNHIATALQKSMSPDTLTVGGRLIGDCALTGPCDDEGETTSVTQAALDLVATVWASTHQVVEVTAALTKGEAPGYDELLEAGLVDR